MSVQTGTPSLAPVPDGASWFARVRAYVVNLNRDPNPVWIRELRQSARLHRTPVILMTVTVMVALLICAVGGVASVTAEPAKVGIGVFHTFFSLAFVLVTWVGPAVAASAIAGEKTGRTWEALALTGLPPARIARGKFLGAYTYIALYLVMLVPVGALPFLFGGVTATEVVLAFVCCFVFAAVAVAFGLAVSSKLQTSAAAIIVTLLAALSTSFVVYLGFGVSLSMLAHDKWPSVPAGPPVWLPTAWVRVDFSYHYLAFLVATPLVGTLLPGWLFYEVTIANLSSPSEDRSTRLRIWSIFSALALTACTSFATLATADAQWALVQSAVLFTFFIFLTFLAAGEPLGPSRRTEVAWSREGRGRLRRALGPGAVAASTWLLGLMVFGFGVCVLLGWVATGPADAMAVTVANGHLAAFAVFLCGFAAFFRARSESAATPRVLLLVVLLIASIGPWLLMAMAGVITNQSDEVLALAAPSPFYLVVLFDNLRRSTPLVGDLLLPALACSTGYVLTGLGLLALGATRTRRRLDEAARESRKLEALLAEELANEEAALLAGQSPLPGAPFPSPTSPAGSVS